MPVRSKLAPKPEVRSLRRLLNRDISAMTLDSKGAESAFDESLVNFGASRDYRILSAKKERQKKEREGGEVQPSKVDRNHLVKVNDSKEITVNKQREKVVKHFRGTLR